ncbi:MAG: tRNA threonylcarbamoyladenosine dehydratase [Eubacteriales bacterium]|nr:tRNA threonylcarbamoyladenosine dehydratase [Eubacteriales bacterium]
MLNEFSRMEILLGEKRMRKLASSKIAVFGLGGVGSFAVEALARCGVGSLTLIDHDLVSVTNINRQLFALHSTIGKPKTQVAKARIRDINDEILVHTYETFFNEDTEALFDFASFNYVIDAMDTLSSKLLLIEKAQKSRTPVISCMGTDNKLNTGALQIADISKAVMCPIGKTMRRELQKRGIRKVKVLFSREKPPVQTVAEGGETERILSGSISFMPGAAGMMIAGEVVKDLLFEGKEKGRLPFASGHRES